MNNSIPTQTNILSDVTAFMRSKGAHFSEINDLCNTVDGKYISEEVGVELDSKSLMSYMEKNYGIEYRRELQASIVTTCL